MKLQDFLKKQYQFILIRRLVHLKHIQESTKLQYLHLYKHLLLYHKHYMFYC